MTWQKHAACRGLTELFYGAKGDHNDDAKAVCATCPVRNTCREQGITNAERFGIWGVLTPREIIAERRKRREAA